MRVLIPAAILDLTSFAILIPILPLYAERLDADKWQLMLVMGAYSMVQFFAAPWLGRLSDRIGRKPVLLASYAGSAVSCLVFAAAGTVPLLILSRVINGATGANIVVAQAIVADVYPPATRTRGMGLLGMCLGIGFIVGPASGGFFYRSFGTAGPPLLAAALSTLALFLAATTLPESRPPGAARETGDPGGRVVRRFDLSLLREAFHYRVLGTVLVVALLSGVAFSTFESTFSQFLARRFGFGPADVGPVFALIGIVIAVIQGGLIGRLARAVGEARLVALGTLLIGVALALIPETHRLAWLSLPLFSLALGAGVLNPALSSLVPSLCPPERTGVMLGVFQSMQSLGRVLGPVWGQFARGTFGDAFPYRSAAVLMAAAAVLSLTGILAKSPKKNRG